MRTSRSIRNPRRLYRLVAAPSRSHILAGRPAWRFSALGGRLFGGSPILRVQAHIIFAESQRVRLCTIIAPLQKIPAQ